jgi:hypothetical protein
LSCGTPPPVRTITVQRKNIVAHQLLPNVMVLIDRSVPMNTNTSTAAPCPSTIGGCGETVACPAGCPTRIGDVQTALDGLFTSSHGTTFRAGVAVFPADNACSATGSAQVLLPPLGTALRDDIAAIQSQSSQAKTAIDGIATEGQMATSDSLRFIGGLPQLIDPDRQNFVMLFTSGVPSCNSTSDDAVAAVSELHAKYIKTIVIAIGADSLTVGDADTLNAMAVAGGFERSCPMGTDAECGPNNTCVLGTRVCSTAFYAAADAPELSQQLMDMTAVVPADIHCDFVLDKQPSSASLLEVSINGVLLPRCTEAAGCNTWTFEAANKVVFQGAACAQLQNATPEEPSDLEFKIFD